MCIILPSHTFSSPFLPQFLKSLHFPPIYKLLKYSHYLWLLFSASLTIFSSFFMYISYCRSTSYVTKFKKTPKPFSTYLFALVLSDFKSSDPLSLFEEKTQKTIEIRHWAPPYFWEATSTRMMNHTLQVVPAIVNHFTELFGIEYKWTKLDQISIPRFEMSAMENPGLLTYKDDVLFPDKRDKLSDMLASIYVVSHELSHQWLGNLVTIEWWRDEWLTEGFATFAETTLQNLVSTICESRNFPLAEQGKIQNIKKKNGSNYCRISRKTLGVRIEEKKVVGKLKK